MYLSRRLENMEIRCESLDYKSNYCDIEITDSPNTSIRSVKLIKQLSETHCKEGRNFGLTKPDDCYPENYSSGVIDSYSIWVDGGCRGVFSAELGGR